MRIGTAPANAPRRRIASRRSGRSLRICHYLGRGSPDRHVCRRGKAGRSRPIEGVSATRAFWRSTAASSPRKTNLNGGFVFPSTLPVLPCSKIPSASVVESAACLDWNLELP